MASARDNRPQVLADGTRLHCKECGCNLVMKDPEEKERCPNCEAEIAIAME